MSTLPHVCVILFRQGLNVLQNYHKEICALVNFEEILLKAEMRQLRAEFFEFD